ncbi:MULTISPECIES: CynX/NimT family MFS transporter [Brevibacillus]|jgi:MFS transporter, CP family, cyanate transporter|uniref:MFS transporter n=1 Tax=Brevibacillus aydinogluensis TaxID=927786 RepID=A0AA48RIN6_9BACL|nr:MULTISPECIES: MFS transporter [Brevibacillus]REK62642.1 MAG: MFS transporter [Brevibacillus sp.]MBR8661574.1 MFS transporter [Brevibacillus sp. NL20B1]MDT3417011.1 CP family cyanate transporter-like MFS transporter [Brevibacillus aydinogluensis]NNV02996.1 MFS transporter [Brevibacillus sp. MCWH]CAJ1003786.1 MFS transporter [Brevibacillus aydinogluensis]
MKPRSTLLVIALFLASLNLRPVISSISPLLETIRSDLGMSASSASLLTSIPVLCMGIFSPIAVKLGIRHGIERMIALALVLVGGATVLRWFTPSYTFLLLTSLIAGIGIATAGPLLSGFIKRYFPSQVAAMIGVYSVAMVAGAALSAGLSVPFQNALNGSWRSALGLWAILAVIALPAWWLFVPRRVEPNLDQSSSLKNAGQLPWRNHRAWLLTVFFGMMAFLFYSITAWLAPAVSNMGYSKIYAGNMLTLFTLVQIPATFLIPMLVNRYPNRLLWMVACSLLELAGLLLVILSGSPWISAILLGIGCGGLFPLGLMLPIDETSNAQDASSWSAMTQSVGYAIGALGPFLVGWIQDMTNSIVFAFVGLAVICTAMIFLQLFIGSKKEPDRELPAFPKSSNSLGNTN